MPPVNLTTEARRDLANIPPKHFGALQEAMAALAFQRAPGKWLRAEWDGQRVVRRGSYRIIYSISDDGTVWIERVRHRSQAYRAR